MWLFPKNAKDSRSTTSGALVYAVGDIHGRDDLLGVLLRQIEDDFARSGAESGVLVFLGDYVDRGPNPRAVIEQLVSYRPPQLRVYCLKGNHEQAFVQFLEEGTGGEAWVVNGGGETLVSYGVTPPARGLPSEEAETAWKAARQSLVRAIPPRHAAFLKGLQLWLAIGDYVFVHAGVRPGAPLDQQFERDLLWIRKDFLNARRPSEKVIVHGHTPEAAPFLGRWRIGLDTGAYATGLLSAVRLQGTDRQILQARTGQDLGLLTPPAVTSPLEAAGRARSKTRSMSAG